MLFIDTETTGLPRKAPGAKKYNHRNVQGFDSARIVSIAWIYENEHGKHDHYFLIKPENFEIPEEAAAIHGITTQCALENGVSFDEAMMALSVDLARTEIAVAHNMDFDKNVLKSEWYRRGCTELHSLLKACQKYCTMRNAQTLLRLSRWPRLSDLYDHLTGTKLDKATLHNAQNDVLYCYRCYGILKERFCVLGHPPSLSCPNKEAI